MGLIRGSFEAFSWVKNTPKIRTFFTAFMSPNLSDSVERVAVFLVAQVAPEVLLLVLLFETKFARLASLLGELLTN